MNTSSRHLPSYLTLAVLLACLGGCTGLTGKSSSLSTRTLAASSKPAERPIASKPDDDGKLSPAKVAEGLKLARLLRDQGRFLAASEVYAQLDQRGGLQPLELLEYATVAAQIQDPQESLALFGRVRRTLGSSATPPSAAAKLTLCNGLARAKLALGQTDTALADFDCVLQLDPANLSALNGKGVLLDAQGKHSAARELFTHANELDPADSRTLNNLALSYLASGNTQQAIRLLTQAGNLHQPTLRLNLAFAYVLAQQNARARQTLLEMMPPKLVDSTLQDFEHRRDTIRQGQPVAEALLAASRQLVTLQEPDKHD